MYSIRAEFEDKHFEDLEIAAGDLEAARTKAEVRICDNHNLSWSTKFDCRGQVVFVGFSPSI